jgi:predicted esterase
VKSTVIAAGAVAFLLLAAAGARESHAGTREETMAEFQRLSGELARLFGDKKYAEAEATCRTMIELAPRHAGSHYNLACMLARQGRADEALASLGKAIDLGWADAAHMRADEDLASLRADERFEALAKRAAERGYEHGAEIEGVKTLERSPAGGLRYRIRMSPDATAEKPNRLVIWLHPSGGSMNRVAESMAPLLNRSGFALMVMTQKQWAGWTGPEMAALLNVNVSDAHSVEGIDARRPVLMGFSAGGQAALSVWPQNASKFGGLVLDAAYPVIQSPQGLQVIRPPADAASCPFFVLVGENDNGAALWKRLAPEWEKAGVPLTIEYIPGKGHAWLFGPEQLKALTAWLEKMSQAGAAVPVGSAPAAPVPGDNPLFP